MQNVEAEKYFPIKRARDFRKRTKQNIDKQSI